MRKKKRSKQVAATPAPVPAAPSTIKRDLLWLTLAGALAFASSVPGRLLWLDHAEIEQANYRVVDAADWSRVWWETIEQYQGRRSGVPIEHGGYWRPIYALGISLDWALWKDCAWCDHVENILWHLAVVVGLYLLGNQVFGATPDGRRAVFWATLLFAVHPLGVHSVTWISGRKDTMCAAFGVASLVALGHVVGRCQTGRQGEGETRNKPRLIEHRHAAMLGDARWFALSAVCLLLAIGSKELGFVVPLMATVLFRPSLVASMDPVEQRRRTARLIGLGVLWACAFLMAVYRVRVVRATGLDAPYPTDSLLRNVAMSAELFWHYVLRIIVPYKVTLSDVWPIVHSFDVSAVLAILALAALVVAVAYGSYRNQSWTLAALWFVIWILPTSGIVPLRHFRAERYLYPASWGVLLIAVMVLLPVVSKVFASYGRRTTAILLSAIAVLFALRTAHENTYWWNDLALFGHSVADDPRHVEGQIELSRLALERNDYHEAARRARLALDALRDPAYVAYGIPFYAHSWLGTALVRLGQPADAVTEFQQALRYMPNSPTGFSNLATAEAAMGNVPSAREHLTRALQLAPGDNATRYNLGLLLLRTGDVNACVELLKSHVLSHPDDVQNVVNYATALTMLGRYDQAEPYFSQLMRDFPDDPAYRARLAWCQWNLGKTGDAQRNLESARQQAPDNPAIRTVDQLIQQHRRPPQAPASAGQPGDK